MNDPIFQMPKTICTYKNECYILSPRTRSIYTRKNTRVKIHDEWVPKEIATHLLDVLKHDYEIDCHEFLEKIFTPRTRAIAFTRNIEPTLWLPISMSTEKKSDTTFSLHTALYVGNGLYLSKIGHMSYFLLNTLEELKQLYPDAPTIYYGFYFTNCDTCGKYIENMVFCPRCRYYQFCSQECQIHYHDNPPMYRIIQQT